MRAIKPFPKISHEAEVYLFGLNETQKQILLRLHRGYYQAEIARRLKVNKAIVSKFTTKLKELDLISEDVTVYEHRGKTVRVSNRPIIAGNTKFYNFSPELQEYILSLEAGVKDTCCLCDIHHCSLHYKIQNPSDKLYLDELPPHPFVKFDPVKGKWHPNGRWTHHKFSVIVSEHLVITIIHYGNSMEAWRARSSRRIHARDLKEAMEMWQSDIEKGVEIFLKYQKKHRRKILIEEPKINRTPHYSLLTRDGKKISNCHDVKLPENIWIDDSPENYNMNLSEIETEKYETAERIDKGLKAALNMSDVMERIEMMDSRLTRLENENRKSP